MEALWDDLNQRNKKMVDGIEWVFEKMKEVQEIVGNNKAKVDSIMTQVKEGQESESG